MAVEAEVVPASAEAGSVEVGASGVVVEADSEVAISVEASGCSFPEAE